MQVLVAGAHGTTGQLVLTRLRDAGHEPVAMIRNPDQGEAVTAAGAARIVHADLESWELDDAVRGTGAVIFAAGSGSGTGVDRTISVDLMGAVRLIDACASVGPDRFIMLSSMGTRAPHEGPEQMRHYYTAKAEADGYLRNSGLAWTIARPGRLSYDDGAGGVTLGEEIGRGEPLSRADLADVLVACIDAPSTEGRTFELTAGTTPVADALRRI